MKPVVIALPGNESLADCLAQALGGELGAATVRRFPDGESYVRVTSAVDERPVVLVCTLSQPDDKLVPLLLLAVAAREAGAAAVGLVAPYLAYMRQDICFQPGETVSARHFARWLSHAVDWLVTVDPHLHRIADLSEVYSVPTRNVHAAPAIADWLRENVAQPVLIGPDEESRQWVDDVARRAGAPSVVLNKTRHGDRDVEVSVPDVERWRGHTPVLVDDIISTGRTLIETVAQLKTLALPPPVCIGVHAVFAGHAYEELMAAGVDRVLTCDTIAHASNRIALVEPLARAARELLDGGHDGARP